MTLAQYLNQLYAEAQYPPLREISEGSESQLSYTTVYNALYVNSSGCRWRTIYTIVRLLGGDVDYAQGLWKVARAEHLNARIDGTINSSVTHEDIQQLTTAVDTLHQDIVALREDLKVDREKPM